MAATINSTIHGVTFFNTPNDCINNFKRTHWVKKAIGIICSVGNFFLHALYKISLKVNKVEQGMIPFINADITGLVKKKLVVCLHGLNDNPSQFKRIADELQTKDLTETDIFIPRIVKKGNGTLDEMTWPISEAISNWSKREGDKELVLVGVSNGGRIARSIEADLAKNYGFGNIRKIRFISVVGACKGSYLADIAHKVKMAWVMSRNIAVEMPVSSVRNQQLNQEWLNAVQNNVPREISFIASPFDCTVPNYSSTLMDVPEGIPVRYGLVDKHGHDSITQAVTKTVAELALRE